MKLKLLLEEKTIESIYHSDDEDFDALVKADKDGEWIYKAGKFWENFDYKKGLDALIKKRSDQTIYYAGLDWKEFDYEKGLEALKNTKSYGNIYDAGKYWKKFNYIKGLDALIKIDNSGYWIYNAGEDWKKFNYDKGLDTLKKISKRFYKQALKSWPKGIKASQERSKEIKDTAKKMKPSKKLRL